MRHIDLSFSSILKKALNEDMVQVKNPRPVGNHYSSVLDRLKDAIKFRRFISLYYDDRKGDKDIQTDPVTGKRPRWDNPRDYRKLIPYALYFSNQNDELTLRCYHYNNNHTKRGPKNWKEMKVSGMKNVRILSDEFTEADLPNNMNKSGDKHAKQMVAMVDFNSNPYEPHEEFMSPLERERERMRRAERGQSSDELYTNQQGPVQHQPVPNVKRGRNLKTMQNLGKPGNLDYKKAYNAVNQTNGRNAFRDWDAAEAERRDQQTQQQRPMTPPQNNAGPVNTMRNNDEEEDWDEYLNNPNNNT